MKEPGLILYGCLLVIMTAVAATVTAATTATIPAGDFFMGCSSSDTVCEKDEGKAGGTKIDVAEFRIDRREVTVANYRKCVNADQCKLPLTHQRSQYCNYDAPDRNQHPVNCIDWESAQSYCNWQGGRLPWEAEWEKAARATSTTAYPWGNKVDCSQAILDDGKTLASAGTERDGCGEDRTWPVASRHANLFGLYDMHGNAGEWTGNWYAADAIEARYAKADLQGPVTISRKVVRGGSWDENINNLRSSFRNVKPPRQGDSIYGSIGFRCVYQP